MGLYEDIFSSGPLLANHKVRHKKLIEFISKVMIATGAPRASLAAKGPKYEKLIYNSNACSYGKRNKNQFYRYELLWKKDNEQAPIHGNSKKYAIVMQGQICKESDFTVNTLLHYKKIYPDAMIILSTWEDEDKNIIELLEKKGINCILNKYPPKEMYGRGNLNLQLINTLAGVKRAHENPEITYILKTRTDQRIYMVDFLNYFSNLLAAFPTRGLGKNIQERIVFMNCEGASAIYYPFKLSDMLTFGSAADILNLYQAPLTELHDDDFVEIDTHFNQFIPKLYELERKDGLTIEDIEQEIPQYRQLIEHKMRVTAETYLVSNYIKEYVIPFEIGSGVDYLDVHFRFLRDFAVIVDKTAIELYWLKYQYRYLKVPNYKMCGLLDHAAWLNIYLNYEGSSRNDEEGINRH